MSPSSYASKLLQQPKTTTGERTSPSASKHPSSNPAQPGIQPQPQPQSDPQSPGRHPATGSPWPGQPRLSYAAAVTATTPIRPQPDPSPPTQLTRIHVSWSALSSPPSASPVKTAPGTAHHHTTTLPAPSSSSSALQTVPPLFPPAPHTHTHPHPWANLPHRLTDPWASSPMSFPVAGSPASVITGLTWPNGVPNTTSISCCSPLAPAPQPASTGAVAVAAVPSAWFRTSGLVSSQGEAPGGRGEGDAAGCSLDGRYGSGGSSRNGGDGGGDGGDAGEHAPYPLAQTGPLRALSSQPPPAQLPPYGYPMPSYYPPWYGGAPQPYGGWMQPQPPPQWPYSGPPGMLPASLMPPAHASQQPPRPPLATPPSPSKVPLPAPMLRTAANATLHQIAAAAAYSAVTGLRPLTPPPPLPSDTLCANLGQPQVDAATLTAPPVRSQPQPDEGSCPWGPPRQDGLQSSCAAIEDSTAVGSCTAMVTAPAAPSILPVPAAAVVPEGPAACEPPRAVREWVLGGGLEELQAAAQKQRSQLLGANPIAGVVVSEGVDFGVRAICDNRGTNVGQVPELNPTAADQGAVRAVLRGAVPAAAADVKEVRSVVRITNTRPDYVLLLNARTRPVYGHCLKLYDSAGIAAQNPVRAMRRKLAQPPPDGSPTTGPGSPHGAPPAVAGTPLAAAGASGSGGGGSSGAPSAAANSATTSGASAVGSGAERAVVAAGGGGGVAVLLPPGAQYEVEVVLRLDQTAFSNPRAERGLLTQTLYLTFVIDVDPKSDWALAASPTANAQLLPAIGCVAAASCQAGLSNPTYPKQPSVLSYSAAAKAPRPPPHQPCGVVVAAANHQAAKQQGTNCFDVPYGAIGGTSSYAVVVGRRVSAAVVDRRRLLEVQSMLKVTAPPFIPLELRQLFCTHPSQLFACSQSVGGSLFPYESGASVLSCTTVAASTRCLGFRALAIGITELPPPSTTITASYGSYSRSKPHFGYLPPIILAAASGITSDTQPAAAATNAAKGSAKEKRTAAAVGVSVGSTASAAAALEWAQQGGVGRLAVGRLQELVELMQESGGDGGGGGGYGRALLSGWLPRRTPPVWKTEWGKQLGFAGAVAPGDAAAVTAARPILEDVFEAASAVGAGGMYGNADDGTVAALSYQRSELIRYGKLLCEEEDIMERDIRKYNLYNARARVAVFNDSMTTYRLVNWPPLPPPTPPASTSNVVRATGAATTVGPEGTAVPSAAVTATSTAGEAGEAGEGLEGPDGAAAVAAAIERRYRGPRLQQVCAVPLAAGSGVDGGSESSSTATRRNTKKKGQSGLAGPPGGGGGAAEGKEGSPRVLLAAAVEVPGLVEERPQLVAGDVLYLRLARQRGWEFAGQLLAVDGGMVLLVMPSEYWHILRAAASTSTSISSTTAPAPLAHVCFTFDRTPFGRMHDALLRAALRSDILLPPPPPPPPDTRPLPNLPEDPFAPMSSSPTAESKYNHRMYDVRATLSYTRISDADLAAAAADLVLVGPTPLNPEQRLTCAAVMCGGSGRQAPFVLFGPPGTGKTVTLVEAALQVLAAAGVGPQAAVAAATALTSPIAADPGSVGSAWGGVTRGSWARRPVRLLLSAPQNYSADLIAGSLATALGLAAGDRRLLRLNDPRRRIVEAKADVLPYCLIDESTGAFRLPSPGELRSAMVVVCSCSSAGLLREGWHLREAVSMASAEARQQLHRQGGGGGGGGPTDGIKWLEFSHVFVDEAGQALLPETLIPLTLRAPGGVAMLCGDPQQLEPVVRSLSAARGGLATSLLTRLMAAAEVGGHLQRAAATAAIVERLMSSHSRVELKKPDTKDSGGVLHPTHSHDAHTDMIGEELAAAASGGEAMTHESVGSSAGSELAGVMLVRNYRSAVPLLDLPSRLFYNGQLKACVSSEASRAPAWDLLMRPSNPVSTTDGQQLTTTTAAAAVRLLPSTPTGVQESGNISTPLAESAPPPAAAAAVSDGTVVQQDQRRSYDSNPSIVVHVQDGTTMAEDARVNAVDVAAPEGPVYDKDDDGGNANGEGSGVGRGRLHHAQLQHPQGDHQLQPEKQHQTATAAAAATMVGGWVSDAASEAVGDCVVAPAHLLFFGVRGQQCQELDVPSYFNPLEASTVADLVDSLIQASWAAASQRLTEQRHQVRQYGAGGGGDGGGGQEALMSGVVSQHDIGIICTYRKQVFKLRQLLRDRGLGGVRVGTVDDYQGQEERIVFISTVLSRAESLPGGADSAARKTAAASAASTLTSTITAYNTPSNNNNIMNASHVNTINGDTVPNNRSNVIESAAGAAGGAAHDGDDSQLLGLWSHPKRFNVAITRSRALLVVVGHPAVLCADRYWRELVRQCVARGTYRGAGEALVRKLMRQGGPGRSAGDRAAGGRPNTLAAASTRALWRVPPPPPGEHTHPGLPLLPTTHSSALGATSWADENGAPQPDVPDGRAPCDRMEGRVRGEYGEGRRSGVGGVEASAVGRNAVPSADGLVAAGGDSGREGVEWREEYGHEGVNGGNIEKASYEYGSKGGGEDGQGEIGEVCGYDGEGGRAAEGGEYGDDDAGEYGEEYGEEDEELYDSDGESRAPDAGGVWALAQHLAQMATLGAGCQDSIYPDPRRLRGYLDCQDGYYEEMPFRVQL